MLHVFLYYRMCCLFNYNEFLFTSTNKSGAVLFRVGHNDLLRISVPQISSQTEMSEAETVRDRGRVQETQKHGFLFIVNVCELK